MQQQEAKPPPVRDRGLPTFAQLDEFHFGYMDTNKLVEMFQPMIDSGVVWHFPLNFINTAIYLLKSNMCKQKEPE